jgi:hypothetical protein
VAIAIALVSMSVRNLHKPGFSLMTKPQITQVFDSELVNCEMVLIFCVHEVTPMEYRINFDIGEELNKPGFSPMMKPQIQFLTPYNASGGAMSAPTEIPLPFDCNPGLALGSFSLTV